MNTHQRVGLVIGENRASFTHKDPYELICKKNFGRYNLVGSGGSSGCKWDFVAGNYR